MHPTDSFLSLASDLYRCYFLQDDVSRELDLESGAHVGLHANNKDGGHDDRPFSAVSMSPHHQRGSSSSSSSSSSSDALLTSDRTGDDGNAKAGKGLNQAIRLFVSSTPTPRLAAGGYLAVLHLWLLLRLLLGWC